MRPSTLATALTGAVVLCASQWRVAHAGFFVCPEPCEAMLLPRDMESIDDCLCKGAVPTNAGPFRCPSGSAATRLRPISFADCACEDGFWRDDARKLCSPDEFQCTGRYRLKDGLAKAASVADCDCQRPYRKDEASGACTLRKCPRSGNYVKKVRGKPVHSLADCACEDPYTKNDQSGECLVASYFECPPDAQPIGARAPRSFADCHCDWGFVRSPQGTCEIESAPFACPKHSVKRSDLGLHERPRSFADCECENTREYRRNERTHMCERVNKDTNGDGRDEEEDGDDPRGEYTCPPFARPLAPFPHSVEQCECLPGYGWKTPEMTCVQLSSYACPPHAFKVDEGLQAEREFSDCACARGYYRDDANGACLEWFLANDNGCPDYAFLRHWPLQSKANCQCIYGLATGDAPTEEPEAAAPENAEDDLDEDPTRVRQRKRKSKSKPLVRKAPAQCNAPPAFFNVGFSQCPEDSIATNWPVASADDCMCKDGFEVLPISESQFRNGDGEGFRCVDTAATITTDAEGGEEEEDEEADEAAPLCRAPLVRSPFTSECRLPVEQVRPRASSRKEKKATRGSVVFKGIEYDYVVTEDDIMVIQGDVAIGELRHWTEAETGEERPTHVLHGYYNAERDHRWKDATMCYEIDAAAVAFTATVEDAMAHIAAVTNFQFQRCRNNNCALDERCGHDFVSVTRTASSCFSYIGRIGGRQALGVSEECGRGNLMHVLLHAVGLRHTIDRADRDEHVRVAWECIPESRRSYFIVEDDANATQALAETPYDFFSIMHHPPGAFASAAAPWCQSVFPLIGEPMERMAVMAKMGQRELLAVTDIHAVWQLYPSLQLRDKAPTYSSAQQVNGGDDGATGNKLPVFESRLHTQDDVAVSVDAMARSGSGGRSWGRKLGSFFGALVLLTGFGAFVAFGVVEFRRRAQLQGSGAYYSESLLTDKTMYD